MSARALATFLIITGAFIVLPQDAIAQTPFGGRSGGVFWCNCSFNLRISVGPPRGGTFMYQPGGTILYEFGQIYRSGVWLLGLASGYNACLIIIPRGCADIGGGPRMSIVGTSM
ncbi:MAG: hypothetical protein AAB869_01045 [Patescibacteria group bacterium]